MNYHLFDRHNRIEYLIDIDDLIEEEEQTGIYYPDNWQLYINELIDLAWQKIENSSRPMTTHEEFSKSLYEYIKLYY